MINTLITTMKKTYKRWTPADLGRLQAIYSTTPYPELIAIFGRPYGSIDNRARSMGLVRRYKNTPWTEKEIEVLRELYPSMGSACCTSIPGRSLYSVKNRAREIGVFKAKKEKKKKAKAVRIRKPPENKSVDGRKKNGGQHLPLGTERTRDGNLVRKIAATGKYEDDWKRVNVIEWEAANGPVPEGMLLTRPAIRSEGRELKLVKIDDIPMLVANRQMTDEMRNLAHLKGRIKLALRRIEKLHPEEAATHYLVKRWNDEEDDYLRSNYLKCSNKQLGEHLRAGQRPIEKRLAYLGLKRPRFNAWTDDEKKRLKEIYGTVSGEELARVFGRKLSTIRQMALRMGVKSNGNAWTDDEKKLLKQIYATTSCNDLAKIFDRRAATVRAAAARMGICKQGGNND